MNETSAATSAPGSSLLPDGTGVITTIHLVLIVLIALAAVASSSSARGASGRAAKLKSRSNAMRSRRVSNRPRLRLSRVRR